MTAKWEPTEAELAEIRSYAGVGMTQAQIATIMDISDTTLRHNDEAYKAWKKGQAQAIATVAGSMMKKALAGDNACMFFFLKTQGKWREHSTVRHEGPDGGPVEFRNLSASEIDERLAKYGVMLPDDYAGSSDD